MYFGTEEQQALQRKSDRLTPWILDTPGACITGRLMATDDFDALGWDVIRRHLQEDGSFAFRWMTEAQVTTIETRLADLPTQSFSWTGYGCDLQGHMAGARVSDLPKGLKLFHATGPRLHAMQAMLDAHGIVPLSSALMGGELCPCRSHVIEARDGTIVVTGFVGMLQNRFSPLADSAWMGLIATAPSQRGLGLGAYMTASLLDAARDHLGATRVIGFAAPDNYASDAMLQKVGLTPYPRVTCVMTLGNTRFTR